MSKTYINSHLHRLVEERAKNRCEYCLMSDKFSFFPYEIDHIIAEKHGGKTQILHQHQKAKKIRFLNRETLILSLKFRQKIGFLDQVQDLSKTEGDNLAYTCWRCNRYKGSDLGSYDPLTQKFSFLFHPRKQSWSEHFMFENFKIVGLTPEGRTTVVLLKLNQEDRLAERQKIIV